jgi:hypothetical protein
MGQGLRLRYLPVDTRYFWWGLGLVILGGILSVAGGAASETSLNVLFLAGLVLFWVGVVFLIVSMAWGSPRAPATVVGPEVNSGR